MGFPNQNPLLLLLLFQVALLPISSSHVSLSVSPRILPKSGATLRVQWSGIERPSDLDWLGIYSPPISRDKNFIGYIFLNTSASWRSGFGALELPLVNLRSPYQLRIFRWTSDEIDPRRHDHENTPLPGTKQRLAVSEQVRFQAMDGPEQLHLSFTDRDDEMRVLFLDGDAGMKYIKYGSTYGRLDQVVGTEVRRYERKDMCDWPANSSIGWRDPGFVHDGVMKSLEKGTRYYYKVGSDLKGWSVIHTFVSRDNDSNETIAFLFGDMGTYAPYATFRRIQEESRSTVKWILRDIAEFGDKPSFVSHIGDISYARGYSWLWDEFFNQIEPIAARVPYHVSIGNHEYDWPQQPWRPDWSAYGVYGTDGGGECGVPYSLKFHMPGFSSLATGTGAPDTRNLYYSFDAGVVHFLYISTETDFLPGSHQYEFIKHDLQNVDREKTPYLIVQGHRPMYTTSNELRDAPLRERMLEHLEPLLIENNVTLALWGHVHRYERFCPLRNFTCLDTSSVTHSSGWPVHVVIGMAGQDWQPVWTPRPDHTDLPIFPQPERSMYRSGEFGYTRLVATRERLTLTYIGNHDGQAHDMVQILSGYLPSSNEGSSVHVVESSGGENGVTLTPPVSKENNSDVAVAGFLNVYVKYTVAVLLGAFAGYAMGFASCSTRFTDSKVAWTPVKSVEI